MSRWSALRRSASAILVSHPSSTKSRRLSTMNSSTQSLWLATATTRLIKLAQSVGTCVQKLAASSKEKLAPLFPWYIISASSTTSKLWVWISLYLRSNRNARTSTCLQSSVCLWVFHRKSVRTKRQWLPCARVCSKSPTIASGLSVSSMRWLQLARRFSSGV